MRGAMRTAWVIGSGICALAARGQVTLTAVIAPGQAATGSATGTFNGPQTPSCQAYGKAALMAFLTNTPNPGFDNTGVWQASSGGATLVALQNTAVSGAGGRKWASVSSPIQNRAGGSIFAGGMEAPFNTDRAIFYSAAGGVAQIAAQEGMAATGIAGATFGDIGVGGISEYALNDSGRIAFLAPLTGGSNPRAIFEGDAATQTFAPVAVQGTASPLAGSPTMTFITSPGINGRGDVAFFTNLNAAPFFALLWKPSGGALQAAVQVGEAATGFPAGHVISSLVGANSGPPMFNDHGRFVVSGGVSLGGSPVSVGVWRGAPGALELVARGNMQAPGAQAGAQFTSFIPMINRNGDVCFYANLSAGAQNAGVWIARAGQGPALLTLLNAQAPGMPAGTLLQSVSNGGVSFNNRGEALLNASMNYVVNSTPANGLFAGRVGRLRKVVASGDSLEVSAGVFRTVISVFCWSWNSPDTGRETSINDRGEVAFSCSFVGGGGGTFLARLPHPCPGDANGDDVVNFLDLNMILSQFGMAGVGLAGDLNGDGVVDFLDLNVMLSFFGGAC
ncbi:MAG: choice-of-anchor tandem repeat NxxGxxAF-containing protein [Phycisphaerales bacterium]